MAFNVECNLNYIGDWGLAQSPIFNLNKINLKAYIIYILNKFKIMIIY